MVSGVQYITVKVDDDGVRLDRWFKRYYSDVPHGRLQKWIRTKQVKVDGKRVQADTRLAVGQEVRVPPYVRDGSQVESASYILTDEDRTLLESIVIYQDDDLIVVNKPAGLPVQGGSGVKRSLDDLLVGFCLSHDDEKPRLVHRLDKDTSGVLVLARHREAAQQLASAFKHKSLQKTYIALVHGIPDIYDGTITFPLSKQGVAGHEKVVVDVEHGQRAKTHYMLLDKAGNIGLLKLEPVTGRTHQLRVHTQMLGCPIIGDGKYGGQDAFVDGLSGKMHLHAWRLEIPEFRGKRRVFEAVFPEHMQKSLDTLGFVVEH